MPANVFASICIAGCLLGCARAQAEDEKIFSGPQVGEKTAPFKVIGVYDDQAGREIDFVSASAGKPLLLIFVQELTRPSAGLIRALSTYAEPRREKGLHCGIVWLTADRSQAEEYLSRARQSLNLKSPVGISPDGAEGPGSYGLNRKVSLTVLVARDNRVTANYALVQPAMTDAPAILAEAAKLLDEPPPTLAEIERMVGGRAMMAAGGLRDRLRPLIRKEATEAEVERAAAEIEQLVGRDKQMARELGEIAQRVVASGNLSNYGTPAAQEQLRRWAEKYGPKQ